ncbi:hypothetical protein [Iningainema tapete]|uniref:Uncharacterized protein n=1 Tax=Iningainema tapete BLCC-T55 TaxID=2748662 RepID=A0A8J6XGC9_9CYAN|nr:hypothetical protein [Iningainema tapete]MBD2771214.1 hypothetical protein [Iningainema tapete BLCC-T55]
MTPEIREELKRIQSQLKKPFPAKLHEIRDLPGGGRKWVFLSWQVIRERLDDVCPEWIIDYSEIQYLNNDAICRAAITILGIRKEAIASVPISILSKGGNEMSRGSAADRLAAESLKNAAEQWGVGRYLDDQLFTIKYLWERMKELDDQMAGEVRRLSEQYKIDKGFIKPPIRQQKEEGGLLHALAGIPAPDSKREAHGTKDFVPQASPKNSTQDLYPQNNLVVRQVRSVTGHDVNWIYAQCKLYECDRPGMMPSDVLEKLVADMCADWAVSSGAIPQRDGANTSIQGALEFGKRTGQSIASVALNWLERHKVEVKA